MEILQGFYWSLPFLGGSWSTCFSEPPLVEPCQCFDHYADIIFRVHEHTDAKATVSPKREPILKDMPSPTFGPIFCMGSSLLKWTPTLECASSLIYVHFRAYDTQDTWHTTPAWSHRRVWTSLHNSKGLSVSDESFLRQSQAIMCQRICEIEGY